MQAASHVVYWPWWLTWAVFLLVLLLLPTVFGWRYAGSRRTTFRYLPWGAATEVLWVALITAMIWAFLVLLVGRYRR